MRFTDAGYSSAQFNNAELRKVAQRMAVAIPRLMREVGADAVVVTGKSGISIAFATLMLVEFPLVVVRKNGENSHGNRIEGNPNIDVYRYIILDDFVSSGATIRTIISELDEYRNGESWRDGSVQLECVGVLEWSSNNPDKHGKPFNGDYGLPGIRRYSR